MSQPAIMIYVPDGAIPDRRGFAPALAAWVQSRQLDPAKYQVILFSALEHYTEREAYCEHIRIVRWQQSAWYKRIFQKILGWDPLPIERKLAQMVERYQVDLVHVHQLELRVNLFRRYCKRQVPVVLHAHNHDRSFQAKRGVADCYIAASNMIREHLLSHGFPAGKVMTVNNAVDTEVFLPLQDQSVMTALKTEHGITTEKVLLFFGRKREIKGYDLFLRMVERLQQAGHAIKAIAIGAHTKVPVESIVSLNQQLQARGVLIDLPPQSHMVLNQFIQLADAVVLPSRSEPQGMAMIEVMAAGGILISCAVGGIRESVIDRQTGFLMEVPVNEMAFDQLVLEVINMPLDQKAKIAQQARQNAVARYGNLAITKELEAIYDKLLAASNKASA
jgi:glycosyltransferase involved in cell wall biosynthesis